MRTSRRGRVLARRSTCSTEAPAEGRAEVAAARAAGQGEREGGDQRGQGGELLGRAGGEVLGAQALFGTGRSQDRVGAGGFAGRAGRVGGGPRGLGVAALAL